MRGHADGAVMCGVIGVQQGRQDAHKMPRPVGCHVVMNHALQCLLETFNHGAFDVIILTGDEVYVPGLEKPLEGCQTHFGALVTLHGQQQLVFNLTKNGLHGGRCLDTSFAGQRSCSGTLGEYVYATEIIPGAVVGLSVLTAIS